MTEGEYLRADQVPPGHGRVRLLSGAYAKNALGQPVFVLAHDDDLPDAGPCIVLVFEDGVPLDPEAASQAGLGLGRVIGSQLRRNAEMYLRAAEAANSKEEPRGDDA